MKNLSVYSFFPLLSLFALPAYADYNVKAVKEAVAKCFSQEALALARRIPRQQNHARIPTITTTLSWASAAPQPGAVVNTSDERSVFTASAFFRSNFANACRSGVYARAELQEDGSVSFHGEKWCLNYYEEVMNLKSPAGFTVPMIGYFNSDRIKAYNSAGNNDEEKDLLKSLQKFPANNDGSEKLMLINADSQRATPFYFDVEAYDSCLNAQLKF